MTLNGAPDTSSIGRTRTPSYHLNLNPYVWFWDFESCFSVSSRRFSIHSSSRPHNISSIQVYAPTSDYDDEEIEKLYEL
ncbi:hypothetical protein DPMN_026422 [Dreissena polymorpha]|uniref:Uncharacterized protein n=1 Tax=Dreissena polymorpha TaxID=45954 RepID=A0A9D4LTE3_DREPO|nr:hypothetical protein DPMN_026422 [Dreissena polymorpha]